MKKNKGVSLITLLITVVVMIIIVSIVFYNGVNMINDAKKKDAEDKLKVICSAILKNDSFLDFSGGNTITLQRPDFDDMDLLKYYDEDFEVNVEKLESTEDDVTTITYTLVMKDLKSSKEYTYTFDYNLHKDKYNYDVSFNESKGVNRPIIIEGMTALMPDGVTEVEDVYTANWYNYDKTRVSFAKMKYEDKIYVWIPRFGYDIQNFYEGRKSEYVPSTAISIAFLRENTSYMQNDEVMQGEYKVHPAFSKNGMEYPGIWVEQKVSRTANDLPSSPLCEEIAIGANLHMMTNEECGAIMYLMHALENNNEVVFNENEYVAASADGTGVFASSDGFVTEYTVNTNGDIELNNTYGDAFYETPWDRNISDYPTSSRNYVIRNFKTGLFDFTNSDGTVEAVYREVIAIGGKEDGDEDEAGDENDDGVYTVKLIPGEGISYISVATAKNMEAEYPDLIEEYWTDYGNIMHSTDIYFEESEVVAEGNYIYIPTNYFVELEIPVENFVSVSVDFAYGDGYVFDNLSVSVGEESFENEDIWYGFTMPATDVVITANARKLENYTITFNSNGGSGTMASVTQEEGTMYTLPSCTFTAPEGYVFSGWLVNGESKPAGASIDVTGNITVKPEWIEGITIAESDFNVGEYVIYPSDKGNIFCRIWEIREDGSMVIMPSSAAGDLILGYESGTKGTARVASAATSYFNAATIIQNYCKEYTSKTLGVTAGDIESLTLEELNEKTGYTPIIEESKYAYYASGTSVSGTTTAADGLAGYTKIEHTSSYYNSITAPRFYTYDYAKNTAIDEEGNTYAYSTSTDPVFVTSTYYYYNPSKVSDDTAIYGKMLGSTDGWLPTSLVYAEYDGYLDFQVRTANNMYVSSSRLYTSYGYAQRLRIGVRPLVTLSSTLKLDGSVSGMDGTGSNPWQFVK